MFIVQATGASPKGERLIGAQLGQVPVLLADIRLCRQGLAMKSALAGNTKGGSITVPLTSSLTGLE
jgi:hypothetical protein